MSKQASTIVVGITGTPGTGKKTVGNMVANKLGYEFLDINKLAKTFGAEVVKRGEDFEVDTSIIYRELPKILKGRKAVVVGHLLPQCLPNKSTDFVAVFRCSPKELIVRYKERGYSKSKIKANIIAEAIDICLSESMETFSKSKISEIDTTDKDPEIAAGELIDKFRNPRRREVGIVNWLQVMIEDRRMWNFLK